VSVSNGVVYGGSLTGHMNAFNAESGQVLWDYLGQGASNAGPAIANNGSVYWGNGYGRFGLGAPSTTFYAFSLEGK
jgi:polyvinyl alcohol dehydrogenase (cytochrome)